MTWALIRILAGIASMWPYFIWRREFRKENERRAVQERLDQAIRGAR